MPVSPSSTRDPVGDDTSAYRRLFAQVDFRREMRPIAFVDPGAFHGTDPSVPHGRDSIQLDSRSVIGEEEKVFLPVGTGIDDHRKILRDGRGIAREVLAHRKGKGQHALRLTRGFSIAQWLAED